MARYTRYLPGCTLGLHAHAEPRIVIPLEGRFETQHGHRPIPVGSGAALFRPVGDEHIDRYRKPLECLTLLLPDSDYLRPGSEPFATRDQMLPGAALEMRVEMRTGDSSSRVVIEGIALLVATIVLHRRPLREKRSPRWIGVVRDQIEDCYQKPPSLAELAKTVHRDPAHVAATFTRVYGRSVGKYLRQVRLWRARGLLESEPDCTLVAMAQRCGFSDQSHFNRHFRRLFRMTPGEYRRRHFRELRRADSTRA